jgi:hypothetical protein
MVLPLAEITYMPGAANLGRPWLRRFHCGFIDTDPEKDCPVLAVLAFECSVHFALHRLLIDASDKTIMTLSQTRIEFSMDSRIPEIVSPTKVRLKSDADDQSRGYGHPGMPGAETVGGESCDGRTDIYALGLVS